MTLKILSLSLCFLLNYTCELWQLTVFLSINIMFHFVFTMLRTFRKCQTVNDKVSLIFLFLLSFLCFTLHTWKKGLYFLFKNSLLCIDFFQVLQSSTQGIKEGRPAGPPLVIMLQGLFKFKHTSLSVRNDQFLPFPWLPHMPTLERLSVMSFFLLLAKLAKCTKNKPINK